MVLIMTHFDFEFIINIFLSITYKFNIINYIFQLFTNSNFILNLLEVVYFIFYILKHYELFCHSIIYILTKTSILYVLALLLHHCYQEY